MLPHFCVSHFHTIQNLITGIIFSLILFPLFNSCATISFPYLENIDLYFLHHNVTHLCSFIIFIMFFHTVLTPLHFTTISAVFTCPFHSHTFGLCTVHTLFTKLKVSVHEKSHHQYFGDKLFVIQNVFNFLLVHVVSVTLTFMCLHSFFFSFSFLISPSLHTCPSLPQYFTFTFYLQVLSTSP